MKKVLLLGCLVVLAGCDKPDPDEADYYVHEGRTIADWFEDVRTEAPGGGFEEARDALLRLGPDDVEALPALVKNLKDDNPTVRRVAVRALGNMGPAAKKAENDVARAMSDKDMKVSRDAIRAFAKIIKQPRPQLPAPPEEGQ
jgi:hypothetical protein